MKLEEYKITAWENKIISKTIEFDSYSILLLKIDKTQFPIKQSIKNLLAIDKEYNIKWIANFPKGEEIYATYDDIELRNNNIQALCNSHLCIIDPLTGNILSEQFIK